MKRSPRSAVLMAVFLGSVCSVAFVVIVAPEALGAKATAIAAFIVGAATLAHDYAVSRRQTPVGPGAKLADRLAEVVNEQWGGEGKTRGLSRDTVLPISWTSDQFLSVGPVRLTEQSASNRIEGGFDSAAELLARAYRTIPNGRIVLLGEPGAGKTMLVLLLTVGLTRFRPEGGAVPVLLSASEWDPVVDTFDAWFLQATATTYYLGRTDDPRWLWERNLLIPVIDGIDEMPEGTRRLAIREINRVIGESRAVVVTCRATEYHDLIVAGSPALTRAPVVRVNPVAMEDAEEYLRVAGDDIGKSWARVFERIRQEPDGPLALAFSTPLSVTLARDVFAALDEDPVALLDEEVCGTRHAVEDWLVDRIIPAAYGTGSGPVRRHAERAERVLTFLARLLHRSRERDLAWWLLPERGLSRWALAVLGVGAGVLVMLLVAVVVPLIDTRHKVSSGDASAFAAGAGLAYAVAATFLWISVSEPRPRRLSVAIRGSSQRVRRGFLLGLVRSAGATAVILAAYAFIITASDGWSFRAIAQFSTVCAAASGLAVVVGVVFSVLRWLDGPQREADTLDPVKLARHDRQSSLVCAAAGGSIAALTSIPVLVLSLAAVGELTGMLTRRAGWPGEMGPVRVIDARWQDLVSWANGSLAMLVVALVVLPAAVVGSLVLLSRAWPRYVVFVSLMAVAGRLPLRLTAFLEDSCRRRILRRSGRTYQFRHARLQERLALGPTLSGPWAAAGEGGSASPERMRAFRIVAGLAAVVPAVVIVAAIPRADSSLTLTGDYDKRPFISTFGPKEGMVAVHSTKDPVVRIVDAEGKLVAALPGHAGGVAAGDVVFSRDGTKVATASSSGGQTPMARLWDIATRQLLLTLPVDALSLPIANGGLVFGVDGETVAAMEVAETDGEGRMSLWNISTRARLYVATGEDEFGPIFDNDGLTFVSFDSGDALIRSMASGEIIASLGRPVLRSGVPEVTYDQNGRTISASLLGRGTVIFDSRSGGRLAGPVPVSVESSKYWVSATRTSADNRYVALIAPRRVEILDTRNGRITGRIVSAGTIMDVQLSRDGSFAYVLCSGGDLRRFARTGELESPPMAIGARDNRLQLAGRDQYIVSWYEDDPTSGATVSEGHVWRVATGRRTATISGVHPHGPNSHAGSNFMVDSQSGSLQFINPSTGRTTLDVSQAVEEFSFEAALSPDRLVTTFNGAGARSVIVYDTTSGSILCRIDDITLYTVLPGALIATAHDDGAVQLWDLKSGRMVAAYNGHAGMISSVTLSPNGRRLATSAADGTVRIWDVPSGP